MTDTAVCTVCGSSNLNREIDELTVCQECGLVVDGVDVELVEQVNLRSKSQNEAEREITWEEEYIVTNGIEERVATSLDTLESMAAELELSVDLKKRAARVFAAATERGLVDGRKTEAILGAILCLVTREIQTPIPQSRVAAVAGVERRSISRYMSLLSSELRLDIPDCKPSDYLWAIGSCLGVTDDEVQVAESYVLNADQEGLVTGRSPTGIAGGALYLACSGAMTQQEVADAAGVSKETIRVRVRDFRERGVTDGQV